MHAVHIGTYIEKCPSVSSMYIRVAIIAWLQQGNCAQELQVHTKLAHASMLLYMWLYTASEYIK